MLKGKLRGLLYDPLMNTKLYINQCGKFKHWITYYLMIIINDYLL